jgi:hypothetical protein
MHPVREIRDAFYAIEAMCDQAAADIDAAIAVIEEAPHLGDEAFQVLDRVRDILIDAKKGIKT